MNLNARPWVVVSSPGKGQEGHHTALQAAPTPHATAHQPRSGLPEASVGDGRRDEAAGREKSTCHPANASHHPHLCPPRHPPAPDSHCPKATRTRAGLQWEGVPGPRWGPQGVSSESHFQKLWIPRGRDTAHGQPLTPRG